jgi:hypothetical protein
MRPACASTRAQAFTRPRSGRRIYTEALKRSQLRLYGDYAGSKLGSYEEDHLISLELGGSPTSPRNLWPEAHPSSYTKDGVESTLNHAVCSGRVKLVPAQRAIAHNWKTAEHALGLRAPDITARLQSVTSQTYWSFPCFPACRSVLSRR